MPQVAAQMMPPPMEAAMMSEVTAEPGVLMERDLPGAGGFSAGERGAPGECRKGGDNHEREHQYAYQPFHRLYPIMVSCGVLILLYRPAGGGKSLTVGLLQDD